MRAILDRIAHYAVASPEKIVVLDERIELDYQQLRRKIEQAAALLDGTRIALLMDNSCAWAIADLAIAYRGAIAVPIPPFFSPAQIRHLLTDAAPDLIVTDRPTVLAELTETEPCRELNIAGHVLHVFMPTAVPAALPAPALPPGTCKITYTSGTTGQPKGVCLSSATIEAVTFALADAGQAQPSDRSLSLLPLSTLLENIAGVYVPLTSGSTVALPALASCGFSGSSSVQPALLLSAFHRYRPSATILVPQLLKLLVELLTNGAQLPTGLRFVAVGGAPCGEPLIRRAWALGLPVYEGYGLSEAGSVVSLNRPGLRRPGSVGTVLHGLRVRLAEDGEIFVAGRLFEGYLGAEGAAPTEWPTGDLGRFDDDGYLYLVGRKKTAYATAFGRNVAPEWVESELIAVSALLQAAVFGEGRARNVAVLVPHPSATTAQVDAAVATVNAGLPDYAQIGAWCVAEAPFMSANGLARPSGAPDRDAIAHHYASALEHLYAS